GAIAPVQIGRWWRVLDTDGIPARPAKQSLIDRDVDFKDALELERNGNVVKVDLCAIEEIESLNPQLRGRTAFTHRDLRHRGVVEIMTLGIDLFDSRLGQSSRRNASYASFAIVRLFHDKCEAEILNR